MKKITVNNQVKHTQKVYDIYENVQEFEAARDPEGNPLPLKPLHEAREGDYVLSNNGYYVPCLHYYAYDHKTRPIRLVTWKFPRHSYTSTYYLNTGNWLERNFVYSFEIQRKVIKVMNAKSKLLARYLSEGMDIYEAYTAVYGTKGNDNKLRKLVDSDILFVYMREKGLMENMKATFRKSGITEKFLAETMLEVINDKKANPALKKFCLEKSIELLSAPEKPKLAEDGRPVATEPEIAPRDIETELKLRVGKTA